METLAQYFLKPSGRAVDHSTVRFGSGAGPRLYRVCSIRKELRVTSVRPSSPIPPMDSVTQVEVTSTEHEVSRIYEDEFGITKCYAHLKFNTQYKLWFPKEEKRPLTVVVTHGNGEDLAVEIGETTLSFDGKTFPLKQSEDGEALDDLTEHLLLKES